MFLQTIQNQKNLLAPLIYTKHVLSAYHLAKLMFLSLPQNSLVKDYIEKESNKEVNITSNINSDKLEPSKYISLDSTSKIKDGGISTKNGVYLITHDLSGNQYIGSAINFKNRLSLHKQAARNPTSVFHKFVEENTWKSIKFGPVYESANYLVGFRLRYPTYKLSQGEIMILSHFTHLETRTLEQSLITKFSPKLNVLEKDVTFTYNSWDPNTLSLPFNTKNTNALSVEVRLKGEKKVLIDYPSIQKAADALGVSRELISRYMNNTESIKSPVFDMEVLVQRPNANLTSQPIIHPTIKDHPPVDYDVQSLPLGYLYALNAKTIKLDYNFKTIILANKVLNPTEAKLKTIKVIDSKYISRYINKQKVVNTELGQFYFVANPEFLPKLRTSKSKIPWVINLQTGEALKFKTATDALAYFKFTGQKTISNYLDKDDYYLNKYQIISNEKLLKNFPKIIEDKHLFSLDVLPLKFD